MVAAFDVFYCFLHQPLWMTYYMKGEREYGEPIHAVDLFGAISQKEGDLTAQLAAGACLLQICMAENHPSEQDSVLNNPSLEEARQNGSMAASVHALELAVKVRLTLPQICSSGEARPFLGCHCSACMLPACLSIHAGQCDGTCVLSLVSCVLSCVLCLVALCQSATSRVLPVGLQGDMQAAVAGGKADAALPSNAAGTKFESKDSFQHKMKTASSIYITAYCKSCCARSQTQLLGSN